MKEEDNLCIYCNRVVDSNVGSHIIPNALVAKGITFKNVCQEKHNKDFSDKFEREIIKELDYLSHHLGFRSYSKNTKKITRCLFDITLENKEILSGVGDIDLCIPISEQNTIIKTDKGIFRLNNEMIKNVKKPFTSFQVRDLNISKKFEESKFHSIEMYRLVTKIAFESFARVNNFDKRYECFSSIIEFIGKGEGLNPVKHIIDNNFFSRFNVPFTAGDHLVFSYIDENNNLIVIVILFGVMAFSVKLLDNISERFDYFLFADLYGSDGRNFCIKYKNEEDHFLKMCEEQIFKLDSNLTNAEKNSTYYSNLIYSLYFSPDKFERLSAFYFFYYESFKKLLIYKEDDYVRFYEFTSEYLNHLLNTIPITEAALKERAKVFKKSIEENSFFLQKLLKRDLVSAWAIYSIGKKGESISDYNVQEYLAFLLGSRNAIIDDQKLEELKLILFQDKDFHFYLDIGIRLIAGENVFFKD